MESEEERRFLFSSDFHGNIIHYHQFFTRAMEQKIRTVMIGGDLFPRKEVSFEVATKKTKRYQLNQKLSWRKLKTHEWKKTPENQLNFFVHEIKPIFQKYLSQDKDNRIILVFGNADIYSVCLKIKEIIQKEFNGKIKALINEFYDLDEEYQILGFSNVSFKDSPIIDWQRFDSDFDKKRIMTLYKGGFFSSLPIEDLEKKGFEVDQTKKYFNLPNVKLPRKNINEILSNYSMENEILKIKGKINKSKKLIMISHCPPVSTPNSTRGKTNFFSNCNHQSKNEKKWKFDRGSLGIRNFIETNQPDLVLCGHVHKCIPKKDKKFKKTGLGVTLGKSKIMSSGNHPFDKRNKCIDIIFNKKGVETKRIKTNK